MRIKITALVLGLAFLGFTARASVQTSNALGDIRTFEVHNFEKHDFSSGREMVPPEIVEYARTAIQNDERLMYRSPGEGIVHFSCDSPECGRIKVIVTQGEDGPVVWSTSRQFRAPIVLKEPNSRQFAKDIVKRLASDYESAVKENPVTIPIKE